MTTSRTDSGLLAGLKGWFDEVISQAWWSGFGWGLTAGLAVALLVAVLCLILWRKRP
jgi:hypothetical protein